MSFAERMTRASNRFYDSIRSKKAADGARGEATAQGFDHLKGHKYALLVTYKRSGEPLPTPIWFGLDDQGRAYIRTSAEAVKLRRIANDPRARLAPCTMRGKPLGPFAEGTARAVGPDEEDHAEHALEMNYGMVRKVYERTGGNIDARYIEVTPA